MVAGERVVSVLAIVSRGVACSWGSDRRSLTPSTEGFFAAELGEEAAIRLLIGRARVFPAPADRTDDEASESVPGFRLAPNLTRAEERLGPTERPLSQVLPARAVDGLTRWWLQPRKAKPATGGKC